MPFRSASTISPVISTLSSFWGISSLLGRGISRDACAPRETLDHGHVRGLGAFVALLGLVLHLRAFVERAVARALDRAEVDEQVLTALVGGDEPVALVRVEPLDSSGCHFCLSPPCQLH